MATTVKIKLLSVIGGSGWIDIILMAERGQDDWTWRQPMRNLVSEAMQFSKTILPQSFLTVHHHALTDDTDGENFTEHTPNTFHSTQLFLVAYLCSSLPEAHSCFVAVDLTLICLHSGYILSASPD